MLTRAQKADVVANLKERVARANSMIVVDYRGLTVQQSSDLRARLRKEGEGKIEFQVVKNTLVRLATDGTALEGVHGFLQGPTAVAISYDDPSVVARVLIDFAKENEKLQVKGGVADGEVVDLAAVRALAELPTKHELRGMLAGTIQAPLRNLAGTMYALLGHLRNALEQRQGQLED
jgi:large subunit ribosomal protein L10